MNKFIHVDMDAFYVSVELRDKPNLQNQPVAVGGKSSQRGVLTTCNYLAREYGVRSAMPSHIAKEKCPNLVIVPSNMDKYKKVSSQIHLIFKRYTDFIEPLSLDEAYLDVTTCEIFSGSATLIAQDIRRAIYEETGLTASAGVAPLKFLAKIASDLNKPNGQYVIGPEQVIPFIQTLQLEKIPGVGKVTIEKLHDLGLKTGCDIRQSSQSFLIQHFGKFGLNLWNKCQGIDKRGVQVDRKRKSIAVERTFNNNTDKLETLENYLVVKLLPELISRSQSHLTKNKITKIGVKVKFSNFTQTTKEQVARQLDQHLFLNLLAEAFYRGRGKSIRLLGIFIGIEEKDGNAEQLSLPL